MGRIHYDSVLRRNISNQYNRGRVRKVNHNKLNHGHSLPCRILCLMLAGLTACSTTRSQYVWHDVGTQQAPGMPKASQIMENWGARPAGLTVTDPEIAPGFLLTLHCLADNKLNG